jgi:hypothetical protein
MRYRAAAGLEKTTSPARSMSRRSVGNRCKEVPPVLLGAVELSACVLEGRLVGVQTRPDRRQRESRSRSNDRFGHLPEGFA